MITAIDVHPVLETIDLSIGYGKTTLLHDINLRVKQGELICLLGPNGVGKSTLLRTLTGMQPLLAGHITIDASPLDQLSAQTLARKLGVVLTDRPDVGALSAYSLVALGRHPYTGWLGRLSAEDEQVIRDSIIAVGAEALAPFQVSELSDGQRQKIMIARALAQQPALIVLDEPTAFLDLPHRVEILSLLRDVAHKEKRAVVLSTHDLNLALHYADVVWLMVPGEPIQVAPPEDLALSGTLGRAFPAFDEATGGFTSAQPSIEKPIALEGDEDSNAFFWTRRALQRLGYSVQPDVEPTITVTAAPDYQWQVENQRFGSIEELLDYLNR